MGRAQLDRELFGKFMRADVTNRGQKSHLVLATEFL
jgi:hypothetical protein